MRVPGDEVRFPDSLHWQGMVYPHVVL